MPKKQNWFMNVIIAKEKKNTSSECLKNHINTIHEGVKKYKCNICKNAFSTVHSIVKETKISLIFLSRWRIK